MVNSTNVFLIFIFYKDEILFAYLALTSSRKTKIKTTGLAGSLLTPYKG